MTDDELRAIHYAELVGPNPVECFPYEDASVLHMGSCQIFAKALHDIFGYEMCRVDLNHGFHMFCRTSQGYLDASGLADTAQELVDRLPPIAQGRVTEIQPVDEVPLDDEYDAEGYAFAMKVIQTHMDEYRIADWPDSHKEGWAEDNH